MQLSLCSCLFSDLFGFFYLLWFLCFFWLLELWLIKLSSLKFVLAHKTFSSDIILVIVWTFSCILIIHQSLYWDEPSPLLIGITCTEVKHVFLGAELKTSWNHILIFSEIAFICFDFPQIDKFSHFFEITIGEDEDVIPSQYQPSFSPLL